MDNQRSKVLSTCWTMPSGVNGTKSSSRISHSLNGISESIKAKSNLLSQTQTSVSAQIEIKAPFTSSISNTRDYHCKASTVWGSMPCFLPDHRTALTRRHKTIQFQCSFVDVAEKCVPTRNHERIGILRTGFVSLNCRRQGKTYTPWIQCLRCFCRRRGRRFALCN